MKAELNLSGRIAILGAGREGLAAFEHIAAKGSDANLVVITESLAGGEKEAGLLAQGVLHVSPFSQAGLGSYDVLVRSPGVSAYRNCLVAAASAGARIVTPSSIWFAGNPDAKTIVITGTKGKSTTAALLAHLLGSAGISVQLAGNIGTPLLACKDQDVDWWVIELSSYQLADLEARPSLGVLLNLATDHLDWHGTEARYHADKLRLAELVSPDGLVANRSDARLRTALADHAEVTWFDGAHGAQAVRMPPSLPGRHNRANLAACLAVTRKLGLDDAAVLPGLDGFKGLPHRLRSVGFVNGIEFVDDSISTAPIATVAALESFSSRKVILLVGGYERGIDWLPYAEDIAKHPPAALIALPDNGPRIIRVLENAGIKPELGSVEAENLADAVEIAGKLAPDGSVVLLSPGAPSFPRFKNYEDRGHQFAKICSELGPREQNFPDA